jgi:hypothetical protein
VETLAARGMTFWCCSIAAQRVVRSNLFRQARYSGTIAPGYWLLCSVGPDLHDDRGRADGDLGEYQQLYGPSALGSGITHNLVFAIPLLDGDSAKPNEPRSQGAAKDRAGRTN